MAYGTGIVKTAKVSAFSRFCLLVYVLADLLE